MSITWNKDWILPYESLWSIFEKLKYTNQVTTKQLIQMFGTNESKAIKTGKVSKRYRNLNTLEGLDTQLLEKTLGLNLPKFKNDNLQLVYRFVPKILQTKELFHENLVYCRECINLGYHSIFHQVAYLHKCSFHLCELETVCYHCGFEIPNQLSPHEYESGYLCSCGESLLSERKGGYVEFVGSWSKELLFQDERVIRCINQNPQMQNKIDNSILVERLTNKTDKLLDHLISSTSKTNQMTYTLDNKNNKLEVNLYDELYNAAREVLNSFEKYLKKMLLSDHSHCIRRFSGLYKTREDKSFPEICPYAYAYVFWKESFYNINPFYNEVAPRKKRGLKSMELPFFFNNECIKETLYYITKNYVKINVSTLIWIVRHLVWNVAKNHFSEWFILAKENAAKGSRPLTKYDNFSSSEILSFIINEIDSTVELHLSKIKEEARIKLNCPYREKKYKVIQQDEISHLPIM